MADMKGITCCGDCVYYDWKKKRCKRCASIETDPRSHFFDDCPLPSVEPERPKGRWIAQDEGRTRFMCSVCKSENHQGNEGFCPNCGADMRGESE